MSAQLDRAINEMRVLVIILFTIGLVWAYASFAFFALPVTILVLWHNGEQEPVPYDILGFCFLLFANSAVGYWIWFGWLVKFRKNRYIGVCEGTFWKWSSINHFMWVLLLPILFGSMELEVEGEHINPIRAWIAGTRAWPYLIWPTCVLIISLIVIYRIKVKREALN